MSGALDNKVTIVPPKLCRNICSRHEHCQAYQDYFNFKLITLLVQNINLANLSDIRINQLKALPIQFNSFLLYKNFDISTFVSAQFIQFFYSWKDLKL